jgi:hypothetical protein
LAGTPTLEDARQFDRDAHAAIGRAVRENKRPCVIVSDLRASHLFPPEVTDNLLRTMRGANPNLERHGMLGSGSALLSLQLARLIREATQGAVTRRIFSQTEGLVAWLDELLTPLERARMRNFISELDTSQLPPSTPFEEAADHPTAPSAPAAPPGPRTPPRRRP